MQLLSAILRFVIERAERGGGVGKNRIIADVLGFQVPLSLFLLFGTFHFHLLNTQSHDDALHERSAA